MAAKCQLKPVATRWIPSQAGNDKQIGNDKQVGNDETERLSPKLS
ncbi:hypothetical protein GCM10007895_14200 [Paraferrimonas sedimenticola]|uniref:Uncharacterized protein n=1 Tax=Paraferrimonas sedimenticola TaxID=375674 RepID=A0AA37VVB4_9GAMM|nr:hypothetical protein GCM10007895_14200 [Paraferrimonas sedimenticola]